jgi:hypothetical protein
MRTFHPTPTIASICPVGIPMAGDQRRGKSTIAAGFVALLNTSQHHDWDRPDLVIRIVLYLSSSRGRGACGL